MKAEKVWNTPSSLNEIKGFVWWTVAPMAIFNYLGILLSIEKGDDEIYKIKFLVKAISGRAFDYQPSTEKILTLLFKDNVQFYTNPREAEKIFSDGVVKLEKLFSIASMGKMEDVMLEPE
ncbi:MAG: hypothetical protein PHF44_00635 [Candidatus Pacebacteria bacterium]|nr:hypothetical protein [Candidatus Paceibacterota bacterium]